jgi:hypothetical protein
MIVEFGDDFPQYFLSNSTNFLSTLPHRPSIYHVMVSSV